MAIKSLVDDPRWEGFIDRYYLDITGFVTEVCDMAPSIQQVELFDSVSELGSRTSVRSGHGTGKSRSIGVVVLWHLLGCVAKFFEIRDNARFLAIEKPND